MTFTIRVEKTLTAGHYQSDEVNITVERETPPSETGVYRDGRWTLDGYRNFGQIGPYLLLIFGQPGDVPVTGDWNGDGRDEAGIFRNGIWALDFNGNMSWDAGDKVFVSGEAGDIPVVGDWNDNGNDSVGIYRNGLWGLDYNDNYAWDGADKAFYLGTTEMFR